MVMGLLYWGEGVPPPPPPCPCAYGAAPPGALFGFGLPVGRENHHGDEAEDDEHRDRIRELRLDGDAQLDLGNEQPILWEGSGDEGLRSRLRPRALLRGLNCSRERGNGSVQHRAGLMGPTNSDRPMPTTGSTGQGLGLGLESGLGLGLG